MKTETRKKLKRTNRKQGEFVNRAVVSLWQLLVVLILLLSSEHISVLILNTVLCFMLRVPLKLNERMNE